MKRQRLIFIYILVIFLIGCRGSSGETELQHLDKSPESLNDVSSGIDDIGGSLDTIERFVMDIPLMEEEEDMSEMTTQQEQQEQEQTAEGEDQGRNGQESSSGNSGDSSEQESQESEQSQEPTQSEEEIKNQKIEKTWQQIEKKIEEIHGVWNEYEVKAQKKGATMDQLDSFEGALNQLTMSVSERNIMDTYGEISEAYLTLRPIFDLYLDDIMAELTNLKYDTYRAYTMGIMNNEEMNFQIFENNSDLINRIKHKLDDESKNDLIDRLENAIISLKKGLSEDSRRVNMIKKNIVLENIDELQ